jgi:hypothetical protein
MHWLAGHRSPAGVVGLFFLAVFLRTALNPMYLPENKVGWSRRFTTYLYLVSKSRMRDAPPHSRHVLCWNKKRNLFILLHLHVSLAVPAPSFTVDLSFALEVCLELIYFAIWYVYSSCFILQVWSVKLRYESSIRLFGLKNFHVSPIR